MSEQPRVPAAPSPNPHGGEWTSAKTSGISGPTSVRAPWPTSLNRFTAGKSGYEYGYRGLHGDKELQTERQLDPETDLQNITKHHLGKALGYKELAQIAGVPKGSRVTSIQHIPEESYIEIQSDILDNDGSIIGRQERSIYYKQKMIYNKSQTLSVQGQGIGTEGLVLQVKSASAAGFKSIQMLAAGKPGTVTNGYYTWPRLGFIPSSPRTISLVIRIGKAGAADMSDINLTKLMATKTGRNWWLANGFSHGAHFDLTEGSVSRRVLTAYAKEKGIE